MQTECALSEEMLDKIMLLFWERGYFNTSMHDLIVATGYNRAAIYKHFGGKQGLFHAMLLRFRSKVVVDATLPIQDPQQGVEGLRQFFLQFMHCGHDLGSSHGCMLLATAANLPSHEPEVAVVIEEFINYLRSLFYKNLRCQQAEKKMDSDVNTEMAADFLTGNVVGLINLIRVTADYRMIANQVQGILCFLDTLAMRKSPSATLHVL